MWWFHGFACPAYALFNTNGTVWDVNGHSTFAVTYKLNLGNLVVFMHSEPLGKLQPLTSVVGYDMEES